MRICDARGRPRWHALWEGNPAIVRPDEPFDPSRMLSILNAKDCRPYIRYPFTQQTGWTMTGWRARDHVGHVYLTEEEREIGWIAAARRTRFVLIEPSLARDTTVNKDWGFWRYLQLVDRLPDVTFVRLLHADHRRMNQPNVLEVRVSSFRIALAVLSHASAYVGAEGAFHHGARILGIPAVVLFGGAISVEHLGYPEQVNLTGNQPGTPCGRYLGCTHCGLAMEAITVEEVAEALTTVGQVVR